MDLQKLLIEIIAQIRGMWRYRWQMIGVAWVVALAGWFVVYNLPDVYESTAQVSVDTNSLLPDLTEGLTATENLVDEVDLVSKALLTRPNLEDVARETDLDLRAETPMQMESLITGLQQKVKVSGGRDNIFTISYQDWDRQQANDVVAALLNTFMETSLGAQGDDAEMTERALRLEIDDHEQRLLQAEANLADFKKRNLGYMPEDGADYYTRLQSALAKVSETERQMRLLRQRRDEIARQLEGEEPVFGLMPSTAAQSSAGCSKAGAIAQLQAQLSQLQVDFTDRHPRIVMLKETITSLEEECAQERAAMGGAMPVVNPELQTLDANPVYQNLRLQLSNANVELAEMQEELSTRQRQVAQLRADVDKIAEIEVELKSLNRDYSVVEGRHQELLRRWETLQSRKRLDPVTDQVQFNILEPPFAAAEPVAPNRPLLLGAVLVLALGAGGVVAFGLNQLKPVYYRRQAVAASTGLPVLGTVSMIMSPHERWIRRRRTIAWVGANFALFFFCAAIIVLEPFILRAITRVSGGGI